MLGLTLAFSLSLSSCVRGGKKGGSSPKDEPSAVGKTTGSESKGESASLDTKADVEKAVRDMYTKVLSTYSRFEEAFTEENARIRDSFLTEGLKKKVQAADEESGKKGIIIINADYWVMGQDFDRPSFRFMDATVKDAKNATARVKVCPYEMERMDSEGSEVDLTLKKEDGMWKVDDFYNRKFGYSLTKEIEEGMPR